MVCSICGMDNHIRTNKKYHPIGGKVKNKAGKKGKPKKSSKQSSNNYSRQLLNKKLTKSELLDHLIGGAKKGLLADLLKGIDLRIQSL